MHCDYAVALKRVVIVARVLVLVVHRDKHRSPIKIRHFHLHVMYCSALI
jgi:hypothetical protein